MALLAHAGICIGNGLLVTVKPACVAMQTASNIAVDRRMASIALVHAF